MNDERWVVLGLAHPRARWFSEVAKWASSAALPIDFVKCVSADEARARLRGGRAFSALLTGGDVSGLDRDLIELVRAAGASVIVVGPPTERDWAELGVAAVLPDEVERTALLATLTAHAAPIDRISDQAPTDTSLPDTSCGAGSSQ